MKIWDALGAGEAHGDEYVVLGGCVHEPAGGTAHAEGGVLGQRDIFEKVHAL